MPILDPDIFGDQVVGIYQVIQVVTCWFPIDGLVTSTNLKGHFFTITKRSPAELPNLHDVFDFPFILLW